MANDSYFNFHYEKKMKYRYYQIIAKGEMSQLITHSHIYCIDPRWLGTRDQIYLKNANVITYFEAIPIHTRPINFIKIGLGCVVLYFYDIHFWIKGNVIVCS